MNTFASIIITALFALGPKDPLDLDRPYYLGDVICCHIHADGSLGCFPPSPHYACGWEIQCPNGAEQTDPDDEESWDCIENGAGEAGV